LFLIIIIQFFTPLNCSALPDNNEIVNYISHIQYVPFEEDLTPEVLVMESNPIKPTHLTMEEAEKDVERLFYLLKNGYSGYGYFSSFHNFSSAKENVLQELQNQSHWTVTDFSNLIHNHLNFLHDCHLSIGGKKYGSHMDFWYDQCFELKNNSGVYLFSSNDVHFNVTTVNGENPENYLFPSLNAQGEAILRLGVLSYSPPDPLIIRAQSGQQGYEWTVLLGNSPSKYSSIFMDEQIGGIPVVRIRSFGDSNTKYVDMFLECARKYQDEPCIIIDVRGNSGGNEAYPRQWVTEYTGVNPERVQIFTQLVSETAMMGRSNYFAYNLNRDPGLKEQGYDTKMVEYRGYADSIENDEFDPYWLPYNVPGSQIIPNNNTIIVLMDANVFSAGEGFLGYLNHVENVVFIGENSGGAVIYGQMSAHRLPNSKLLVNLPISLNFFKDLVYREEKGFYPDLWVPSGDALNYAVTAVRKGTITTLQSYQQDIQEIEFIHESQSFQRKEPYYFLALYFVVILGLNVFNMIRKKE